MIQLVRAVTIVIVLGAGGARGSAQPSIEAAISRAELEEAKQLNEHVKELYAEGKYQEAGASAERALVIREKLLGPEHPDVAESLNSLAVAYYSQGAYTKAEPLYVRALTIRENALGSNHPDVAESLNDLGVLYWSQGVYSKVEPLYTRALAIREKALGPMHPHVAESLNNLAQLYRRRGKYRRAESLYVRAIDIEMQVRESIGPDVMLVLNNLAELYRSQGEYTKAEPLYVNALRLCEEELGRIHPFVALTLIILGALYHDQGAYAKAEQVLVRAKELYEKTLGRDHPHVATALSNLAVVYKTQGAYDKSELFYARALDIREKALGSVHPDIAESLNNLAVLYVAQGKYAKAESYYARSIDINKKALGPAHPLVARSMNNLAALYLAQGRQIAAEQLDISALKIHETVFGTRHPDVAYSLNSLARLYQAQGAYGEAERLMARAAGIQEDLLHTELVQHSEPRKRALVKLLQRDTDSIVSFHADAAPTSTSARDLALTTVLRRKGRILDSLVDGELRIRRNLTPRLRDLLDQLAEARTELVAELYARSGRRNANEPAAADAVRGRIEELETKLSAASAEFRTEAASVSFAKVRVRLPKDAALVEFAKYRRFDPKRPPATQFQEERYVAYLLTARGDPMWVALGEAAPIDAQVDAMLAAIGNDAPVDTTRVALQRLDGLVLAPIRAKLPGISHFILAPDDKLNLVPFDALVDPQGHYALENYLISYVTTGRDLLRIAAPRVPRSPAVIMADPDYGPLPFPGSGAIALTPLPDAQAEAADLQPYFPAPPLTGANATKAKLASLTAPAIIHVATHGFYARDVSSGRPPPGVLREMARGFFVEADVSASSRSDDLADGLDRAGLALAGANQGPDGIVTAREIAGFDWWGTQLVVLSACETGVGAASSGDGVYGLRRALVLAGAASQVVSLWNVEDSSTRQLMREFYGNLARGVGRAEALRRAKLSLLHQPQYEHPFFWAAFIAAGDWRPLAKGILTPSKAAP